VIGSLISGIIGQQGAQQGGEMAASAANQAAQMNQQEAGRARQAMSPWSSTGIGALSKVAALLGIGTLSMSDPSNPNSYWGIDGSNAQQKQDEALNAFQTSPGYSWRKQEGVNALDRSAAAKGLLLSGAQVKGVQGFGDGLAAEEWRNYMADLKDTAGMGQSAASSASNTSANLVSNASGLIAQGGMARGSGYTQGMNALASGIGNGINNALFMGTYGANKGWFSGSDAHSLGGRIAVSGS
jgi:hypothetical protein